MKPRYWVCIIGIADQDNTPKGSDTPMRRAVEKAFEEVTGHDCEECMSGWGVSPAKMRDIHEVWCRED